MGNKEITHISHFTSIFVRTLIDIMIHNVRPPPLTPTLIIATNPLTLLLTLSLTLA